jgi:hypothetical protein
MQAGNLLAGDLIHNAIEMPVLINIERVEKGLPGPTSVAKKAIKTVIVRPFQGVIEWFLKATRNIEGEDVFQQRMALTKEKRIDELTDTTFRYGTAYGVGQLSWMASAKALNHALNVPIDPKIEKRIFAADPAIHIGAIALMSSPLMKDTTGHLRDASKCVFKSFGMNDEKAQEMSSYALRVLLPNYATWAVNVGMLALANRKGSMNGAHAAPAH